MYVHVKLIIQVQLIYTSSEPGNQFTPSYFRFYYLLFENIHPVVRLTAMQNPQ